MKVSFTIPGRIGGRANPLRAYALKAGEADYALALNLFGFLCPKSDWMKFLVVPGEPASKARARAGANGHFYAPDKSKERAMGWRLKEAFKELISGNIAVGCIFFRSSKHRIDVDNMLKHVMDAATGVCWKDDAQVTAKFGAVELDANNPRTVIVMGAHRSTMDRSPIPMRACEKCGGEFTRYGNGKFCSRRCSALSRGEDLREPIACPKPKCADCGVELSRHGYRRCRACWLAPTTLPEVAA